MYIGICVERERERAGRFLVSVGYFTFHSGKFCEKGFSRVLGERNFNRYGLPALLPQD